MTLYNHNVAIADAGTSERFMHSVVTACILVDKGELRMGEPFDESFFFNYEDHDFGIRCSLSGHRIISVPAALCYHGGGTEGLSYRKGGAYTDRRMYHLIRNRWQILLKDYQLRTLFVLSPMLLLFEIFQLGGLVAKGWGVQWLKSAWWIFRHLPEILQKRHIVQQSRKVADMELFDIVPLPLTDRMAGGRLSSTAIRLLDRVLLSYWKLIHNVPWKRVHSRD
jgi:GT2 family glycosyltransferase